MPPHRRDHLPHGPYPRTARVNELLREVLAEELERLSDIDERLPLITITGIDTSADLRRSVVYVSTLEPTGAAVLEEHRNDLQRAIARQVRMKRTPHLEFSPDPAVEQGMRVEEILRRVRSTDEGSRTPVDTEHEPGDPSSEPKR